jgi:hypothetical protein
VGSALHHAGETVNVRHLADKYAAILDRLMRGEASPEDLRIAQGGWRRGGIRIHAGAQAQSRIEIMVTTTRWEQMRRAMLAPAPMARLAIIWLGPAEAAQFSGRRRTGGCQAQLAVAVAEAAASGK